MTLAGPSKSRLIFFLRLFAKQGTDKLDNFRILRKHRNDSRDSTDDLSVFTATASAMSARCKFTNRPTPKFLNQRPAHFFSLGRSKENLTPFDFSPIFLFFHPLRQARQPRQPSILAGGRPFHAAEYRFEVLVWVPHSSPGFGRVRFLCLTSFSLGFISAWDEWSVTHPLHNPQRVRHP